MMQYSSNDSSIFLFALLFVATILSPLANGQGLKVGFYEKTCPNAEAITKKVIGHVMLVAPSLSGPLLRMHFHDCFIRGCDGSILLDSPKNDTEKYSPPNLSLRGYQIIDKVKTAMEKECPGVVSCADILAIVARDVSVATKAQSWEVETGRRDGKVSNLLDALNLPPPLANISTLKSEFSQRGLNTKDLVVLSGGHTLGMSHCSSFDNRLYNFTGKGNTGDSDPTLDSEYAKRLMMKCKPGDQTTLVELDPGSSKTFDVNYFTVVGKRRGLLQSDAALLDDEETKAYVKKAAAGESSFFKDFGVSMVKMGRIGALTGKNGEIRKVCSKVN